MQVITHEELRVDGVEYKHILELQIHQKICEHAKAEIKLEVADDNAQAFVDIVTERAVIRIYGKDELLFAGIVEDTSVSYGLSDTILNIVLSSTSKLLDCIYESRSYPNVGETYYEIMQNSIDNNGIVEANFADKNSIGIIIQYQETDWEFIRRLALECSAVVVPDITSYRPKIIVGTNRAKSQIMEYAGNTKNGKCIVEVLTRLIRGVLTTYTQVEQNDKVLGTVSRSYRENPVVGKIFSGIVKSVEGDKIKAHITDVDPQYREGNWWFPYSTIYSSPTNMAGIYSMPKKEEPVRLFFPSEDASEAFAASSCNIRENVEDFKEKVFTSPQGMSVKFYESGLMISCKEKKVYIDLKKSGEILLRSNEQISIVAKELMHLSASDKIKISSDNEVFIGTQQSCVSMKSQNGGTVDFYAPKIFVK